MNYAYFDIYPILLFFETPSISFSEGGCVDCLIDACLFCTKIVHVSGEDTYNTSNENEVNISRTANNDHQRIQMPIQMYEGVRHEKVLPNDHFRQKIILVSRSALNRFIEKQPSIEQIAR